MDSLRYLSIKEAALYIGCAEKTIRRAVWGNKVRYVRVGLNLKFKQAWLDSWLEEQTRIRINDGSAEAMRRDETRRLQVRRRAV